MSILGKLIQGALEVAGSAAESVASKQAAQNAAQASTARKSKAKGCTACGAKKRGVKLYNNVWKGQARK